MASERYARRASDKGLRKRFAQLSARELDGRTSKEIAKTLRISSKTVDVHRANIMRKMGVATSAELVRTMGRRPTLP